MGQYKNKKKRLGAILTNLVSTFPLFYIPQYLGNICDEISLVVFVAASKHQISTPRKYTDSNSLEESMKESKLLLTSSAAYKNNYRKHNLCMKSPNSHNACLYLGV